MIVPALLTDKKEELVRMIDVCSEFTDCVQVDIMDGKFVASTSVTAQDLKDVRVPLNSEAHLMVNDPLAWVSVLKDVGVKRILFHSEIDADLREIIDAIKLEGLEVGLALNPATEAETIEHLLEEIDVVLFMSVVPGFYGAKFIPAVLDKIRAFKERCPWMTTAIDGGIKLDNVEEVVASGVDIICVGSAILKAEDPAQAFLEFQDITSI